MFYLASFWELTTTRRFDMGHIPWGEKLNYARYSGLDDGNTKAFIYIIGEMDVAFLKWVSGERKKASNGKL